MNIAKPDKTEEMYQKNFALLPPWLKSAVSNISEEEYSEKVEIAYNKEGLPICRYNRDGGCFHITSAHPAREAKAWGRAIKLKDSAQIFLYGCGFGYALFELFAQKPPQTLVIVYEWDICLFKAMLYHFDLSPLVQTQKIVFLIGNADRFLKPLIELFSTMLFDITTVPTVIFTYSAARNFKKEYLEIHRRVFEELSHVTSFIGNSHQDDLTGLRNLLGNTIEFLKSPNVSSMKDKFAGTAAIIVSNGPSLDKSIPLLKKAQGKCLMLCAESAIVPLTKNGIKPDIMCSIERTKANYFYHFENRNHSPDISLFALGMVDPRIFRSFTGEKMPVFRKGEGLNCWFNRHIGDGSGLDSGASAAHLAVSAAIYLGADPIIFVGQDLSYGEDGATHSKDAVSMQHTGKQIKDTLHSLPTVFVEGNDGETLPSNHIWVKFRFIMESIISNHQKHRFYNATEGGAKIQGTERAKLSELIGRYCADPLPYPVTDIIAKEREKVSIKERAALLDNMLADIERYAAFFRDLSREANTKKLESESMIILCSGKDEEKYRHILDETYKKNLASFYRYSDDDLCGFFSQRVLCAYFFLFSRIGAIDTRQKRTQIFELHRQFFRDMRAICQSLAVTFEEARQSVADVREELNVKVV
ncbi:MAG: 6-hydroxymethylpterin diphosphokinase MptE-like protein [Christensenellales bacterium]